MKSNTAVATCAHPCRIAPRSTRPAASKAYRACQHGQQLVQRGLVILLRVQVIEAQESAPDVLGPELTGQREKIDVVTCGVASQDQDRC